MTRRLIPLAALGLLPAPASALPCPPPPVWWGPVWGPPVVWVYPAPPVTVFDPCCRPLAPVVTVPAPATPAAPKPTTPMPAAQQVNKAEPAAPKLPQVEAEPASPLKPIVPAADKPADTPKLPSLQLPAAPPPKPADKPADPTPAVPKGLDLKPANPGGSEVPPLSLPLPPKETKTSYSSPLPAPTYSVRLVPAAGPAPASPDALRRVVFVNLTKSEVVLTVAGETAVLPARHELTATVPASFKWRLDGGELRTAEVPGPGADVVIRAGTTAPEGR